MIDDTISHPSCDEKTLILDSRRGGSPKLKEKCIFHLRSIMSMTWLTFRLRDPGLRQFTWRRKTPLTIRRFDFFLISNTLQSEVKSCEHLFPLSTDHTPVKLHFHPSTEHKRGAGYWKFDNSLLENNKVLSEMKVKLIKLSPSSQNLMIQGLTGSIFKIQDVRSCAKQIN